MKTIFLSVLLCLALFGCKARDSATKPKNAEFTAEKASDALVRFIRHHPGTFLGDPNPDKLAQCPVMSSGDGRYSFGAFTIDVAYRSYFATIMAESPVPVLYSGQFIEVDGVWTALPPNVRHVIAPPGKPNERKEPAPQKEFGASAF